MGSECSFGEDHCGVVIVLEAENARLKEALRECVRIGESLGCTDPDCQHVSCAMLKKAREVLGDEKKEV